MYGLGWLGWDSETVMTTPIPQIMLALEGKVDFVKKTNPFGGGEKEKQKFTPAQQRKIGEQRTEFALMMADAKTAQREKKAHG